MWRTSVFGLDWKCPTKPEIDAEKQAQIERQTTARQKEEQKLQFAESHRDIFLYELEAFEKLRNCENRKALLEAVDRYIQYLSR